MIEIGTEMKQIEVKLSHQRHPTLVALTKQTWDLSGE